MPPAGAKGPPFARRDLTIAVDSGANRGQFSLFARTRLLTADLLAFEPLAGPAVVFATLFAAGDVATNPSRLEGRRKDDHRNGKTIRRRSFP